MGYFACSCACCCFHFTCGDFSTCSELQNVKNECVPCTIYIISKSISLNVLPSMILFFLLFFHLQMKNSDDSNIKIETFVMEFRKSFFLHFWVYKYLSTKMDGGFWSFNVLGVPTDAGQIECSTENLLK